MEAHENLLKDIITRQAGDWKKGLLEMTQNAVDSHRWRIKGVGNNKPYIFIKATPNKLVFMDQGAGLGPKPVKQDGRWILPKTDIDFISRIFGVFGNSIKDANEDLGAFGMGRGQSISIIYDAEKDKLAGKITVETSRHGHTFRLTNFRVDEELSFDIEYVGHRKSRKYGTTWTIESEKPMFDRTEIISYLRRSVVGHVIVFIDEDGTQERVTQAPAGRKIERGYATFWVERDATSFNIYDRVLFVEEVDFLEGVGGTIVAHDALKVNFARNEVVSSCPILRKVKQDIANIFYEEMDKTPDKNLRPCQRSSMLALMKLEHDSQGFSSFDDRKIFTLANGKKVDWNKLSRQSEVFYSKEGSRAADRAIQAGVLVLDRNVHGYDDRSLIGDMGLPTFDFDDDGNETAAQFKAAIYKDIKNPTKNEKKMVEWLTESSRHLTEREIKVGSGPKDTGAWTDGITYITFTRKTLSRLWSRSHGIKSIFLVLSSETFSHEIAHDNDDRDTDYHSYSFDENHIKKWKKLTEYIAGMMVKDTVGM